MCESITNERGKGKKLVARPAVFEEWSPAAAATDDSASFSELLPFLSSESSVLPFLTAFSFPVAGDKLSMHTALGPGRRNKISE